MTQKISPLGDIKNKASFSKSPIVYQTLQRDWIKSYLLTRSSQLHKRFCMFYNSFFIIVLYVLKELNLSLKSGSKLCTSDLNTAHSDAFY